MMKQIEYFWNVIHYVLYKGEVMVNQFFRYPFRLFYEIKFIKKLYKVDPFIHGDYIMNDKKNGLASVTSGIHMGGYIVIVEFSLFNFAQVILNQSLIQYFVGNAIYLILGILALLVPAGLFNYLTLFKNDKYLEYFKKIDAVYGSKKSVYILITIAFSIMVIALFVVSLLAIVNSGIYIHDVN